MSESLVLAAIVGGLVSVAPIVWLPCYLAGHLDDIAAGWMDGCGWLAARRKTAAKAWRWVRSRVKWLRVHVLPGRGHHRKTALKAVA